MSEAAERLDVAWPDWTGAAVAIVASGPSVKKDEVRLLEGRAETFAIKRNIEIAPWASAVYGCDYPWWRSVLGLPHYRGLKLAYADRACAQYGCRKVDIPEIRPVLGDRLRFETTGVVGAGGNSGFQALNLAAQFGAARILLIGFDCQDRGGKHWYGRNDAYQMSNPDHSTFRRWVPAFATAAGQLTERGVEVVNASPVSDIKAFPVDGVAATLERWGL